MSALSAPFDESWSGLLGGALTITSRVTATGVGELEVVSGTVTYDEDRTPHVEASIQCRVPDEQDALDALDPRAGCRLVVTVGYRVPGNSEEHVLCNLILTSRDVERPGSVMNLTAVSDEQYVLDTQPINASRTFTDSSDGGAAIRTLLLWDAAAWGPTPPSVDVRASGGFVPSGDNLVIDREDNLWNSIQDIADRIGAWVYHDGLGPDGAFHVVPQPVKAGPATAMLRVGPGGTITDSQAQLGRERFGNTVLVKYSWNDGEQRSAFGYAEVTSGPHAVAAVGRKVLTVEYPRKGTAAQARAAAASMVTRAVTRGRELSIDFEHAPFWLRPGQTITVQLPTGPQERHLVARMTFDIPSGRGHVRTRQPENVSIETGE